MPEKEKGTTVTGGRDASLVGKIWKRTLAERYALVEAFRESGKTQAEIEISKAWVRTR